MYTSIQIKHGSEGPQHDPYSYEEVTVTRPNGVRVTMHDGLAVYVEINGKRAEATCSFAPRTTIEQREAIERAAAEAVFESIAGITVAGARRAHQRLHSRCRNCGCRETCSMAGYPGESFEICVKCSHVVDSHFDLSAVE